MWKNINVAWIRHNKGSSIIVWGVVLAQDNTNPIIVFEKMNSNVDTRILKAQFFSYSCFWEEKNSFPNKKMHRAMPQYLRKSGSMKAISQYLIWPP